MKKVLKFVTGRKDHASTNVGPFSLELPAPPRQATPSDEDVAGAQELGYAYKIDLSGKDKSISKLHKAAWQGNLDKLKVNLKKTDIDIPDRYNRTPLHLAASQGHCNVVWFLIVNNANMNICDNEGKTPLLKAIECGQTETVRLMLERGADINIVDYNGNSGLHLAAKHSFYEIASMLLNRGANEDSNNLGEFPLHVATQFEHDDLIELLLRYGSSVNVVDRDNRSPLMLAARSGRMPLVQLFLEYGAQRAVMDSNDWTAEDYALFSGHEDIAAELKTPSEAVVLHFAQKPLESEKRVIASITGAAKRSVSAASLPPGPSEEKDASTSKSRPDDTENSDTWNDSQLSEPSTAQKGLKLGRFLQRTSEDDGSEASGGSARVAGDDIRDTQDSPRSCVIPPPCKPPRSWDLIQSGVMDDHSEGSEPRRRSLLILGSLRSKRESFGEPQSGAGSPEQPPHCVCVDVPGSPSKESSSTKYGEIQVKILGANRSGESGPKSNASKSDSDWSSDDSLPLDDVDKVEAGGRPESSVFQLQVQRAPAGDKRFDFSNAPTLEKRGRFLPRTPSIDLTDDDFDPVRDKSIRSNASPERVVTEALITLPAIERDKELLKGCSMGRDETMMGYDEIWEANAQLPGSRLPSSETQMSLKDELEAAADTAACGEDVSGVAAPEGSRLTANALPLEEDKLLYPSPRFGQKMDDEADGSEKASKGGRKLESKSLDVQGDMVDHASRCSDVRTQHGKRKHARQQSVSILSWSRSEESHQKPPERVEAVPAPLPPPLERPTIDSKRISAQLQCYDEALRELAQVKLVKKHGPSSLPPTRRGSELALGPNDLASRELTQAAIVRKQGSLSLPRNVDPPSLERASSLGTQAPGTSFFSGNFPSKELAHSAIIKKQGSLSLPRTSEVPDLTKAQSVDVSKEGYLSLPRSNELIDQAFKEIGKSSVKMKRGSRSLPRNITPGDMNAHADAASTQRTRKVFRTRRRAESESEVTDKKSKKSSLKCLSFDFKLRSSKSEESRSAASKSQEKMQKLNSSDSKVSPKPTSPKPVVRIEEPIENLEKQVETSGKPAEDMGKPSDTSVKAMENPAGMPKSSNEKPSIRKKRKILLAMRGLIAPNLKSFSESISQNEGSAESSSVDEHPFWLSIDRSSGLERQGTVIERSEFELVANSTLEEAERSGEPPGHLSERIEEEEHPLSPDSQENRIIREALKGLPSAIVDEVSPVVDFTASGSVEGLVGEGGTGTREKSVSHPVPAGSQGSGVAQESAGRPAIGLTELTEVTEDEFPPEATAAETLPNNHFQADVTFHAGPEFPLPPSDLERVLFLENIPEIVSSGTENRESKSTSQPSSVLTDFYEEQRSPLNLRDTPSDADSGASLNEITPQHEYSLKAHQVLLRKHLHAATEEKGRLEEAAARLGERADHLQYELREAREAARGTDQVVAVLQGQLAGLEARHTAALDQLQRCRLRAANLDQELRHLGDVCCQHEEEKTQLKSALQLKEAERLGLEKALAAKLEAPAPELQWQLQERVESLEADRDGLRAENARLQETLRETEARLQETLRETEARLQEAARRTQELAREKAELGVQLGVEMAGVREECSKWQGMYESAQQRLQACASGAEAGPCDACGGAGRALEAHQLASTYREELKDILEKVARLKETDSTAWQHKIQEEVSSAVAELRGEYDKVEGLLSRHNDALEQRVGKLQGDLEEARRRQAVTDAELAEARQLSEELAHLREVSAAVDEMRVVNGELRAQLGRAEDAVLRRDGELRMKTEHLGRLERLVAEQARALERADSTRRRRSRSFDSAHHARVGDLADASAQTADIPILLLPPDGEAPEPVGPRQAAGRRELVDTASQTHDILVISSDGNEEPFDYLQDEERLVSSEELVIRLRKDNEELQDILEHKTDQLKQMVEKTKSLVKHNERMKSQLNELKSKQVAAAGRTDKETLTEEFPVRGDGQDGLAGSCRYKKVDDYHRTGDITSSHCQVEDNLLDKLRMENKTLRDTLNQLLSETGLQIEKQGDLSTPVTVCMVLGGPPMRQDVQQNVRMKDCGTWPCIAQQTGRAVCSESASPTCESVRRSASCCEAANFTYGSVPCEKERRRKRESKELSSPADSLSDEAPSNVIEVQVSVHRDGEVDSAPSRPSSPLSSGDELRGRRGAGCAPVPAKSRLARVSADPTTFVRCQ
ncbi:uncharacterized protein LOC134532597 [Bacillus rossius redtenbacheri]|uniref:uncharacterized protein LOC134532597 n=1 Tax=Bacillus rossius redtenbacheri TaxID=93214 RepID=UPI002FDD6286